MNEFDKAHEESMKRYADEQRLRQEAQNDALSGNDRRGSFAGSQTYQHAYEDAARNAQSPVPPTWQTVAPGGESGGATAATGTVGAATHNYSESYSGAPNRAGADGNPFMDFLWNGFVIRLPIAIVFLGLFYSYAIVVSGGAYNTGAYEPTPRDLWVMAGIFVVYLLAHHFAMQRWGRR